VRKTDGSPVVRLGDNDAFSISADGNQLGIGHTNAEGGSLVEMPTGAGEARPIKTGNLQDPIGQFLPDQKHALILSSDRRVYVKSLDADTPRPVTPPGVRGFHRAFTADGKYVLGRDDKQNWALYPIGGGTSIALTKRTAGDQPINHTNDNHSFFVRNGDLPANIYRFDFASGARQFVRQLHPSDVTGMERIGDVLVTPDGKYYVYGATRELSNLFVVTGLK
jgi:hypothetical protein